MFLFDESLTVETFIRMSIFCNYVQSVFIGWPIASTETFLSHLESRTLGEPRNYHNMLCMRFSDVAMCG